MAKSFCGIEPLQRAMKWKEIETEPHAEDKKPSDKKAGDKKASDKKSGDKKSEKRTKKPKSD